MCVVAEVYKPYQSKSFHILYEASLGSISLQECQDRVTMQVADVVILVSLVDLNYMIN